MATGSAQGRATEKAPRKTHRQDEDSRLPHCSITGTGTKPSAILGGAHLVRWAAVVSPPSPQRKRGICPNRPASIRASHRCARQLRPAGTTTETWFQFVGAHP